MGVYIKGMKMPKDCLKCPFCLFADGYWKCLVDGSHADFGGTCRPQNCPLVSLPPHGRLIEAEPIVKYVTDGLNSGELGYDAIKVMTEIEYAPTIIPASEEGET